MADLSVKGVGVSEFEQEFAGGVELEQASVVGDD